MNSMQAATDVAGAIPRLLLMHPLTVISGPHRCVCENDLCGELVTRLSVYPKMKEALAALPPKMIRLSSAAPPQEVTPQASDLAARVSMVKTRLGNAKFTTGKDGETVPKLYEDYVKRIAGVLQSTLAFAGAETAPELKLPDL